MPEPFTPLLAALQLELQEYGALLHLFDIQKDCILRRDPSGYLELNPQVERQIEHLTRCRLDREALVRQVARECGQPEDSTLLALTPGCPPARQPLFRALIEEINNLTVRVQRRLRQNREMLACCVEVAREIVAAVDPGALPGTYSAQGALSAKLAPDRLAPTLA
jgi:hypothetical protein